MGTLAAVFLAATLPLMSVEEAPPTDAEIIAHGLRIVSSPEALDIPEPVYETEEQEIICPPPTRLRCWIASDQDAGAGTISCACRR